MNIRSRSVPTPSEQNIKEAGRVRITGLLLTHAVHEEISDSGRIICDSRMQGRRLSRGCSVAGNLSRLAFGPGARES